MPLPLGERIPLGTRLHIDELNVDGVVISVWETCRGTQYEMRYFLQGKVEQVYFFGEELSKKRVEKRVGFTALESDGTEVSE